MSAHWQASTTGQRKNAPLAAEGQTAAFSTKSAYETTNPIRLSSVAVELHENAKSIEAWSATLTDKQRHPSSNVRAGAPVNGNAPATYSGDARAAWRRQISISGAPHMLCQACGFHLANKGHDTRALEHYLGGNTSSTRSVTQIRRQIASGTSGTTFVRSRPRRVARGSCYFSTKDGKNDLIADFNLIKNVVILGIFRLFIFRLVRIMHLTVVRYDVARKIPVVRIH
jgi:hypothetical protein